MADYQKPIPQPTPETQHFWDGCKDGKLLLQRCKGLHHLRMFPRSLSRLRRSACRRLRR